MSRKEVIRPGLLRALAKGQVTTRQVARALRVTVRHVYRLQQRFAEGGVVHRGRGRPSARRLAPAVRERVAALMGTVYDGLNDCHLTEKLHEVEGLRLCRESVRRIRQSLGRPATQPRRPPRHRRRRPPAARAGSLLLLDGSPADWLEARGPRMTLHGALDDATGAVLALHFRPTEDLHGYAMLFAQVFRRTACPWPATATAPLFSSGPMTTGPSPRNSGGRKTPPTWAGSWRSSASGTSARTRPRRRAASSGCGARCRIGSAGSCACAASTPPRRRTRSCPSSSRTTIAGSPMRPPIRPRRGAARPGPRPAAQLSLRPDRGADNTVRLGPRWLQLPPGPGGRSHAGRRVEVRECLDGRLVALLDGHVLAADPSPDPAFVLQPRARPHLARRGDPARVARRPGPPRGARPWPPWRRRCAPPPAVTRGGRPSLAGNVFVNASAPPRGDIFTWQIV